MVLETTNTERANTVKAEDTREGEREQHEEKSRHAHKQTDT